MNPLPRRHSLIEETAAVLRGRIDAGDWSLHLPGEHELAALLQVGRNTLRSALAILAAEGRIAGGNGRRREILGSPQRTQTLRQALLLMSKPVGEYPPATAAWIEGTRLRLESEGWTWRSIVEPGVYRGKPAGSLQTLTKGHGDGVWILHRSTPAMQRWFQEQRAACVLAGSRHEGITLPQVEIDYGAVSRHAAGRFLSRGHRSLAVLRPEAPFAGDDESVASFREACHGLEVREIRCRGRAFDVAEAVQAMLRKRARPTALYVLHAEHCLAALTSLQQAGISIPGDLSLICREDAPWLGWLCPEPARYRHSSKIFASRLAALVIRGGEGRSAWIMPSTIEGATLARVAA